MRNAVFIVAFALFVRLAAIAVTNPAATSFGDAGDYIAHAASLCTAHAYPDGGNLPFFRAPGLPFFIAAVTVCHPHAIAAMKIALAVCDALTCGVIALLAFRLFGARASVLAGIAAAVHPIFSASVCDVRSEPLFMLLLTASLFLLLRERPGWAGVLVALAALTRPSALLCIPLFVLFALVWMQMRMRSAAILIIAAALTLAPWIARNYIRYRELIIVTDAGGFSFWRGVHPETIAITHATSAAAFHAQAWRFETETIAATQRTIDAIAQTPQSRSRQWSRRAIAFVRADPAGEARFTAEKAWLYWRPWLNPFEHSRFAVIATGAFYVALYVLAAFGMARSGDRRYVVAALIFFAAMWLAHLPYQVSMRLRVPFTDPLLIVFAAGALCTTRAGADSRNLPAVS
jgi:hypothetical protein